MTYYLFCGLIPTELNEAFVIYFIRGDVPGLCSPFLWLYNI